MSLAEPATLGYLLLFAAYALLTFCLTRQSGPRALLRALWIASAATALWSLALALRPEQSADGLVTTAIAWTRNLAWLTVLLLAIAEIRESAADSQSNRATKAYSVLAVAAVAVLAVFASVTGSAYRVSLLPSLFFASLMLVLCEQVISNVRARHGPVFKYICIAAGSLFLYELLQSLPVQFVVEAEEGFRQKRGWVLALFPVPLIMTLRGQLFLDQPASESHPFVFRWFVLITLVVVVLGLLVADLFIRTLGGSWPGIIRVTAIAAVACALAVLAVSPPARAQLRVFLTKSFLRYKYDYRKEWLRFIGTLSETGLDRLPSTSVQAIARIVNSPAGIVWVLDPDSQRYAPIGAWRFPLPLGKTFGPDSSLVRFMVERQWVIDLAERQRHPSLYGDLKLDSWIEEDDKWWIIVPMLLGDDLYGFVALVKAPAFSSLNFEDHDLLRTVGRHVATHLKQAESDRQLSEAQQFSTYHRLSAFLMHDLNNLAAQLSLIVKNSEKHRRDPKFIDDMIATVANSVSRMNRLLEQLSNATERAKTEKVNLITVAEKAISLSAPRLPKPVLESKNKRVMVSADPERLCGVLEHLIRNAQDATSDDGAVEIDIDSEATTAVITIRDDGCGMSDEFISERLFRPFDSTKGSQSMGIGAYQAREYIRTLGGQVDVASAPEVGTTFTIQVPVAK